MKSISPECRKATLYETKQKTSPMHTSRNETKPKWAKCSIRETETKHKTTPMPTSRNRNETQNKSDAHLVRNETNETEMGEIDLEAPFRFIRFFFGFECHPTPGRFEILIRWGSANPRRTKFSKNRTFYCRVCLDLSLSFPLRSPRAMLFRAQ